MASYLSDLFNRIAEVEKEAMTNIGYTVDAYPYFGIKTPTAPPFWVNRLGAVQADETKGLDILYTPINIAPRLVIAHATEDYDGNIFGTAYDMIARFETWLLSHPMLTSTLYPTVPNYLLDGVTYVGHSGLTFFTYSGIQTIQLGVEFTIEVPVNRNIER